MKDDVVKCEQCDGNGWYADHSLLHYQNSNDTDCSEYGCPVQVECEKCNGTGSCLFKVESEGK